MQRDSGGRSQVNDPVANLDIANRQFLAGQINTRIATADKGVASGVASLDGTAVLSSGQVPTYLGRALGQGTTLPTARRGDNFFHTGLNAMLIFDGNRWLPIGVGEVASKTARTAMATTYASVIPVGFTVEQTDSDYLFKWTGTGWAYAGYVGTDTRAGCSVAYFKSNQSLANSTTANVTGWTIEPSSSVKPWLTYGGGNFTVQERCVISVYCQVQSDGVGQGVTHTAINLPGAAATVGGGASRHANFRGSGFPGAGYLINNMNWTGAVDPGAVFSVGLYQAMQTGAAVAFNCGINFEIQPY